MLEVHTWQPNANSGKPLFCLHEKGVPFGYHYVDMGKRAHFSPQFLEINRDGTIPAVVHDSFVMTESTPIARAAARPRVREALGGATREAVTMGPERGRRG